VIWGCGIGLSAFIFAEIAQSTSLLQKTLGVTPSPAFIGLLYLVNGVLVYFVSVAVLHRRVVSVAIPLRYGTILTVLTLAVGIPIVNLHELLGHYQEALQIPEWIWLLIIAPVALLLLHRLQELAVHLIDRVLNRRFHATRQRLEDAGLAMLKAPGFDEIDRLLVQTPCDALELSSGAVFRQQDHVFRRAYCTGWDASPLHELASEEDAALLRRVEVSAPVGLPLDAWNRSGLRDERAPSLVVPVNSAALGTVAIALFGPHENGNDIDPDERRMLENLATRAAAGYDRVAFVLLSNEVAELRARLGIPTGATQGRAL
jgi:hypothetical protein